MNNIIIDGQQGYRFEWQYTETYGDMFQVVERVVKANVMMSELALGEYENRHKYDNCTLVMSEDHLQGVAEWMICNLPDHPPVINLKSSLYGMPIRIDNSVDGWYIEGEVN